MKQTSGQIMALLPALETENDICLLYPPAEMKKWPTIGIQVLTVISVGICDFETTDATLGFGPRHCHGVFCHLAEDYVRWRLRAWRADWI